MHSRLPSLDALRIFEVTSRFMSFTQAAEELFVSQSAVSQKIKVLEEQLGYSLFERGTRGLILTNKGRKLLPVVRRSLQDIEAELDFLAREDDSKRITIHTPPSISSNWLIPRLTDFNRYGYEIDLDIENEVELPKFTNPSYDLGIVHLASASSKYKCEMLFPEYVYPVATRDLIQSCNLYNISDLQNATLLHDSMLTGQLNTSWDSWFAKRNLRNLTAKNTISFSRASMIVTAAAAGQGVGLVRHTVAAPLIKKGELVPLFNDVESDGAVFLVTDVDTEPSQQLKTFCKWLLKQGHQFGREYAIKNLKLFQAYQTKSNS